MTIKLSAVVNPWFAEQIQKIENANLEGVSHQEEFAFWLNAYNLTVIKAVLQILERTPQWKGNLSYFSKVKFFYLEKFTIANKKMNLYYLEHSILRKRFKDPRIHFAINCASNSCPFLPGRLFIAEDLDEFLEFLTKSFVNNPDNVIFNVPDNILYLNPIFKWYRKDFDAAGGVIEFIKKYWDGDIEKLKKPKITYLQYDWELNRRQILLV
ncbi:MAG: DUF547 domain-containing protein [Candidatus Hermodarchaeota archaeon]